MVNFPEAVNCTKSISRILKKSINLFCIIIYLIYRVHIRVGYRLNYVDKVRIDEIVLRYHRIRQKTKGIEPRVLVEF